jgi:predicted acyltransferase
VGREDFSEVDRSPPRIGSIDVFRGLVMFLMLSEALHLTSLVRHFPDNQVCEWLRFHWSHVPWQGCSLHDLIQPAFTFLVGVSLPFSLASRRGKGHSYYWMAAHASWRALLLIAIGIVLRSLGEDRTNFTFEDTLTQIGLGYFFLFLIGLLPRPMHYVFAVLVLGGFWVAFAASDAPPDGFDYAAVGVPEDWAHHEEGFQSRWNKNSNLSWQVDQWFMNLFPRESEFVYNGGGYSTLSFVPTLGTMLLGLLAGGWLLCEMQLSQRVAIFLAAIGFCLGGGWALAEFGYCPIVKRIWSTSFALWSGGWCFATLLLLHLVCDIARLLRWAYPLLVIGANSILIYVMSWTVREPIEDLLVRHLGNEPFKVLGPAFEDLLLGAATLLIMFYVLWWLFRRRVFVKI